MCKICLLLFFHFMSMNFITAEILKCNFTFGEFNFTELGYKCRAKNAEIFNDPFVTIEKVEGVHWEGKSNDDVKIFYSRFSNNLNIFPSGISKFFKNLDTIDILGSNITKISSDDLKNFPKLKSLLISGSEIEEIHEDLFIYNLEIEEIILWHNKIKFIDPKTFSHLKKLKLLYLSENECKFYKDAKSRQQVESLVKRIEKGECQKEKPITTTENYKKLSKNIFNRGERLNLNFIKILTLSFLIFINLE